MRLLDTSSLRLVKTWDGRVPPYAILSHTWSDVDDEEFSFQDLNLLHSLGGDVESWPCHPITQRTGFAKIRDSAKLARSQGYGYIWIDTCCI